MAIIKIILTLILFLGIIIALKKKLNFTMALMLFGFIGMALGMLINKTTPVKESTGIFLLDIFDYFATTAIGSTLSGVGIIILTVLAYVAFMDYINASKLFALLLAKPVSKIKNKYVIAWATFIITALLAVIIPNGTGRIALLFGTVYPVMMACGVSKATAATAIFAGTRFSWGPTNTHVITAAKFAGFEDFNIGQHFINIELPWFITSLVLSSIVFIVCSKIFDKKEKAETGSAVYENLDVKTLGVPMYYAIFPVLPIFAIIAFGGNFAFLPTMDISGIFWLCFTIVFIIVFFTSHQKIDMFNGTFVIFRSMGNTLTNIIGIIIGGTVFAEAITQLGGLQLLFEPFIHSGANVNLPIFIILTIVITIIVGVIAANNIVPITILAPVYGTVAASSGANLSYMLMTLANSSAFAIGMTPATAHIAMASEASGVEILTLIKRGFLAEITGVIVYIAASLIMA